MAFFAGFLVWAAFHAIILNWYGFAWAPAIRDSLASNASLAATSLLIILTLQFYIPQKNKYVYLLALCSVLAVLGLLASRSIVMMFAGSNHDYDSFFSLSIPVRFAISFLVTGCMALISILWYTMQDQTEMDKRKSEAEKLSKEAELFKLRQQLQPHFLFNSLNSINALITSQPVQARNMVQQLSDFLRGTLKKEEHQWNSLDEEFQHLQLYLDIEKVRFGHRLSTSIHNLASQDARIPALLLQPIVENAIKFGLYDTTGDINISIKARQEANNLVVEVINPFDPETSSPRKGTGFGLSSVQRRLYLLFARNDLLQTEVKDELFITTIKIPQQA